MTGGVTLCLEPDLVIAGFSLPSAQIQRVFALVELLRGVAAFLAAPILLHLAMTVSANPSDGISTAMWVCVGIAAGAGAFATYLVILGRARLQRPDLERWNEGEEPAWDSPPLAAGIRGEGGIDSGRWHPGTARMSPHRSGGPA